MIKKPKVISFDVDGTLVPTGFVDAVWLEGIPSLYAQKYKISFEEAYQIVTQAYNEVGDHRIEWYYLDYWIKRFDLNTSKEELFNRYRHKVKIYEDVEPVINALRNNYKLIICSNAEKDFILFQLKSLLNQFHHIFSATSDFKEVKKSREFYGRICELLKVEPEEVIHIGDHLIFDYINPREIGINAILINRNQHKVALRIHTIKNLKELLKLLDYLNCPI
ncbi:MAG: HAD family hydrolase [Thermodesulfobacterium geofontis]|uniref:HAD family hydrolase n=1 Tax=Thermodesulfobacterium geofontis TaxID=1295609 RepID=A0A2N7QC59_9BACT|nr:MAG: HAD family hydrolase [Thermodesulfobacterium geofontis]PMP96012.1 MAG: HAD family hydrolase [Thermodesulfobacterium geofontis]